MSQTNQLLDDLIVKLNLKNDAALSVALEVTPPVISKLRSNRLPVGPSMVLKIHEVSGLPVKEIKEMSGWKVKPVLS